MPPMTQALDFDTEGHTIPIPEINALFRVLPYASTVSVMTKMLHYTGGREACLDKMRRDKIFPVPGGVFIYLQPSKNQRGMRKEFLPDSYILELNVYWENNRSYGKKVFGVSGETFRTYFKKMRSVLPLSWQKKRPVVRSYGVIMEYQYQLKGFRKNFQSLGFKRELDEWGDPGIAIEMISKRMCHSSTKITARHYVEGFKSLCIENLTSLEPANLLKQQYQKRLLEF